MSYNTLKSYDRNTLNREDEQDYSVSKCYGNVCSVKSNEQKEDYSTISLRGSIHPPYSDCYGNPNCKKKHYEGVS
jgi:hypothetical protein